jgi:hypothetical protein
MAKTEISRDSSSTNITDRCSRLLGQLCFAGSPIDPRAIRALAFLTDKVDVSGSVITSTISGPIDISDRSARLLGIIYGSQNQKLLQTPINFNTQVELATGATLYDARQIRNLVFSSDKVDISGSVITVANIPTTPINDFNTDSNIAPGSSSTHTYTATGNFRLSSIEASSSGPLKIEVKSGIVDLETTKLVAFSTPSNLTLQLDFKEELQLTTGQRLQVILTNRELQAIDCYSTIFGFYI